MKIKLLLILYAEFLHLLIYIYVLENFTKRIGQIILTYKIGNTRIEFQTSSRNEIKLQIVGSINESRLVHESVSLEISKEIGYVENRE